MSQTSQKLQPYAVPVTDAHGNGFVVYVLASPDRMAVLAGAGSVVMHAGQAAEIQTAQQYADQLQASIELAALRAAGGRVQ